MSETAERAARDPEADHKPSSPTDLTKPSWKYVAKKTLYEFTKDQCTDLAAALTYYAVLALFPAAIALLSLVGLVGQGPQTVDTLFSILRQVGAGQIVSTIDKPITAIANSPSAAGVGFVIGLLTALFSASGYVGSFGRAMNRIYEIEEGRPFYKLRPMMMLVTMVAVLLAALVLVALVISGPAAEAVGNAIGAGSTAVFLWDVVKWPVVLIVVMVIVAILYYATPNIQQPKFRWISVGAGFAVVVWILASVGFGFYVATFSSYNKTYGTLAGIIVFLLWLWITNLALLFGAELDSELERGRQLQAGIAAEEVLQLPPRDTTNIEKNEVKDGKFVEHGRELREGRGDPSESDSDSSFPSSGSSSGDGQGNRVRRRVEVADREALRPATAAEQQDEQRERLKRALVGGGAAVAAVLVVRRLLG